MSAILSAEDLNDFITPGVACIKPVEVKKTSQTGRAEIEIGIDGVPLEVTQEGDKQALEAAQISLSDCLACSGCITSAESVLVSMQSHKEVLNALRSPENSKKVFVCSVSHQVRVSLATAYNMSVEDADSKLRALFIQHLGFKHMVGTEIGRYIALHHGAQEVLEHKYDNKVNNEVNKTPVLSSNCPGWTCYIEKTHPHMISYLSQVKSAQQITGTLVKKAVSLQYHISEADVYHLSLMPCFDKKLEASRPEFVDADSQSKDVDCVITTKEIVQMLKEEDSLPVFEEITGLSEQESMAVAPGNWMFKNFEDWHSNKGSSSGGYMDHVLQALIAREKDACTVDTILGKNSDIVEYVVKKQSNGEVVGRTAQVYGFRNINNLVRKFKPNAAKRRVVSRRTTGGSDPQDWDYVEVMACPGGCLNGGGQIGRPEAVSSKDWKIQMEQVYSMIREFETDMVSIESWIKQMYVSGVVDYGRLLHAEFHGVEKLDLAIPKALQVGSSW